MAAIEPTTAGPTLLRNALLFTQALRGAGLTIDLAAVLDFVRALTLVDVGDREQVKAAGRALFVRRREEIVAYDIVFDRFWRRHTHAPGRGRPRDAVPGTGAEGSGRAAREGERAGRVDENGADDGAAIVLASQASWSAREVLREKSFARMSQAELREAEQLIDRIEGRLERRRTRRWDVGRRGATLAARQMLRRNLATGGNPTTWLWRRPARRPRSLVLICDISGSMERHSRLLLRFGQALARSRVRTEAFVFGTRLTRVTRQLRGRDPDLALARVAASVDDWSGGTRIGESLRQFNQRWARRVLRTSGIVVVVSDGWDRGSPDLVAAEAARLRRNCHRLIWLNPLAGAATYQPLAAGMAAAYPHLDAFLPAHNVRSLERLGELLAGEHHLPARRRRVPARALASGGLPAPDVAAP